MGDDGGVHLGLADRPRRPYDRDMVASWDVAGDVRALDGRHLMRRERQELVSLLGPADAGSVDAVPSAYLP
jgi:hypothetical protein